jgi:DNA-binding NtrC family response regulator
LSKSAGQASSKKPAKPELLLIDDDVLIVESLSMVLQSEFQVHTAESRAQARKLVQRLDDVPSLALVDLGLPPLPHNPDEGFELINELISFNPNMKILVLSGQSDKENIQHALTLGAVDFIPKPCDISLLKARLAHQLMMINAEISQAETGTEDHSLLGESAAIKTLHELIKQFADTPFPVIIEGESGSGKELVAQYLHEQSARGKFPFLTINCAAFTAELLDAQLFGHAKGAFTGATSERTGFFEEANQGSLFLDEIGEMPLELQSKLLRVLENGEFYRLGETHPRMSSARIIAATNRDLKEEVRTGRFRQDLYHRLSVLTVNVPPLRERARDSLMLLAHFKAMYAMSVVPFELTKEAEKCLLDYSFPGNVRELRNIVIRLGAKYAGKAVSVGQLQGEMETVFTSLPTASHNELFERAEEELLGHGFRLDEKLKDWEKQYVTAALKISGGNLSKAARLLGINRTTLYSRLQRLSIPTPEPESGA